MAFAVVFRSAVVSRVLYVKLSTTGRDQAQGLVEYGLIIALVAVIAVAALIVFGGTVTSLLSNLGGSV